MYQLKEKSTKYQNSLQLKLLGCSRGHIKSVSQRASKRPVKAQPADGLSLVVTKKQFKDYLAMLKVWRDTALARANVSVSSYESYRGRIEDDNNTPCTSKSWSKAEEIACVCDDLRDYASGVKTPDELDEDITLITAKGVPVGVITLRVPQDNDSHDYKITGFVKDPTFSGSLRPAVEKYLKALKPRSTNGNTVIEVDSARGAIGAYESYDFVDSGIDAGHHDKPKCGCKVMMRTQN